MQLCLKKSFANVVYSSIHAQGHVKPLLKCLLNEIVQNLWGHPRRTFSPFLLFALP